MNEIEILDQITVDQIAAGEVVERPASVVKELVENAVDAGSTAVTVEIKDGGISLIRITDNGIGITAGQVPLAFQRHATSKIRSASDLTTIGSLGFRGEALSSIAAVAQVELITKTQQAITGIRYEIDGGKEISMEEIGSPGGTTLLIRNLFYNTPARKKFLKSETTEAGYIGDLMEHLALSHPEIAFKYVNNNQLKLQTSGNGNQKEIIYQIYGREVAADIIQIEKERGGITVRGFLGKPSVSRGNRTFECYFINGRYIKSKIISKAAEEAYQPFLMQRRYPFFVLCFTMDSRLLDVNVHPAKMEVRFSKQDELYEFLKNVISESLLHKDPIPQIKENIKTDKKQIKSSESKKTPEPFEINRLAEMQTQSIPKLVIPDDTVLLHETPSIPYHTEKAEQLNLFEAHLAEKNVKQDYRFIGQLFSTYWLMEYEDKLFLIDQHAAHEKVYYERIMSRMKEKKVISQLLSPPLILTLNLQEAEAIEKYKPYFLEAGFEIEHFGGKEFSICAVPDMLDGLKQKELFLEMLDGLVEHSEEKSSELMKHRIASISCKAAVKGNQKISIQEAEALFSELFTLDNPYFCPHGRPTMITMTQYELERRFKR